MYKRLLLSSTLLVVACFVLSAQKVVPQQYKPMVSSGQLLGNVPALRDLVPQTTPDAPPPAKLWQRRNYFQSNAYNNADPLPRNGDPLAQKKKNPLQEADNPELTPGLNFEGLFDPFVYPPDPTGDIGKDHYMQMVNASGGSWLQVWDKQGQTTYGPALSSTIWSQVGTNSIGDPIVQYDAAAQRWLIMEMQGFGNSELLLAVSDDSDPAGNWKAYRFSTLGFPDYPKLYVWPNAYFVTVNEIVGTNKCSGFALDRAAILAGEEQFGVYRFEMPNFLGIVYQPATGVDWEGGPPPPPGSPGYIFRVYDDAWNGGADQLQYWEVNVDWQDVNSSFIDGPHQIPTTPFETRVCWSGLFDCIEQPGNSPNITALENIIMYRIPYRNFGDYEAIVLNHVSDVSGQTGAGGDAAIRWYELRKTAGSEWEIYQEGTYAPDPVNRIMSTISMDENGNIGLGYSAVSENTYPGIRITGRRAGDPLGEMTIQEYTLVPGGGSSGTSRWGDYSNMSVDPEDGRKFWFTGEYQPAPGASATRIGSFLIQRDTYDVTPQVLVTPPANALTGTAETVTVQVFNSGLAPAFNIPLTLRFEGQVVGSGVLTDTIVSGETALYTFTPTISIPTPGQVYLIEVINTWAPDGFDRNDTLRVEYHRATEHDAAYGGRQHLAGFICSSQHTFDYFLRNASGLPLQSAEIKYKLSAQNWKTINWTGSLAPGATDTVPITLEGITNSLNTLRIITALPNGMADQNIHNDSVFIKFFGNLNGAFASLECNTEVGVLQWEIRDQANLLIAAGDFNSGFQYENICIANNTCYTLVVKSKTNAWSGKLRLLDLYGNVLVEIFNALPDELAYQFCTPQRKPVDVGARGLASPVTGGGLSAAEPITIVVRNFGTTTQQNIVAAWQLNGGPWHTEPVPGTIPPGDTLHYTFSGSTADLSALGVYQIGLSATVTGDENTTNDSRTVEVVHLAQRDADISSIAMDQACADVAAVKVALQVRNNGLLPITSLKLELTSNNQVFEFDQSVGPIPANEIATVYQLVPAAHAGGNTLQVRVVGVNGLAGDDIVTNDTAFIVYQIDPTAAGLTLSLFLDDKPEEVSWKLFDAVGAVVYSGGSYAQPFSTVLSHWCLRPGECYTLKIYDAAGNGWSGIGTITQGAEVLWVYNGVPFTSELDVPFCAIAGCATLGISAAVQQASGAGVADGAITVLPLGGTPPYSYSINGTDFQQSSQFAALLPGTYTVYCKDTEGCTTEIFVTIGVVGTLNFQLTDAELGIYPNPTKGLVWLQLPATTGEPFVTAELFDSQGVRLQSVKMHKWDTNWRGGLALDTYTPGAYWVIVRAQSRTWTGKIIKQ